ncbi:MAG: hypothetical protein DWQ29_19035 [Planctomycetota bacterium]|nr:MAG: hypothetical protein DWQ29_19035 [Planctomycetota bacterium]
MHPAIIHNRQGPRPGYLLPAIAVALLVVGLAVALVLDRLWIDAAQLELRTAAEAAALAGASRLVDDGILTETFDASGRAQIARDTAAAVAGRNFAAGNPVTLDASLGGDVLVGRIALDDTGREVFLETESSPTTVLVFAGRTRGRSNPVALFFKGLTGQFTADVVSPAEATIDGRVVGVASLPGGAVPAVPLAILNNDPLGERTDTWRRQIEERSGGDRYSFDAAAGVVREQPDGIPEIVLHSAPRNATADEETEANCHVIDVGTGLVASRIAEQCRSGFLEGHLGGFGGQLRFDDGAVPFRCDSQANSSAAHALRAIIGQPRICLLYDSIEPSSSWKQTRVWATRLAAGRILDVSTDEDGGFQIVFQPTCVTTRAAILREDLSEGPIVSPDIYVYKLHLTQ